MDSRLTHAQTIEMVNAFIDRYQADLSHAHGRTCLIVAHRVSTITHADRVIVLDPGRIVEAGAHTELTARHGLYYAMFQTLSTMGLDRPGGN